MVTIWKAWVLVVHLVVIGVMDRTEAPSVAIDTVYVVNEEESLFSGDDGRDRTMSLLLEWIGRESAGRVSVKGDGGRSSGRMQIGESWLPLCEVEKEKLLDGRENIRCGLKVMRHLRDRCGSVRAALRAYASGTCAGNMTSRAKVEARCKASGAC
jgi:hypothetical protein